MSSREVRRIYVVSAPDYPMALKSRVRMARNKGTPLNSLSNCGEGKRREVHHMLKI
jgi:hypothetical protein